MHYMYLLQSQKSTKYYIGYTPDLRRRLYSHNQSQNTATKAYPPWQLVYYEAYPTKQAALARERVLKHHGRTLSDLKCRIGLVDQT